MEIFSTSLAICAGHSPVTGEFPPQRLVTRSFNVFFYLRLNKRLSKQRWSWWCETPLWRPIWRHCDDKSKKFFHMLPPSFPLTIPDDSNVHYFVTGTKVTRPPWIKLPLCSGQSHYNVVTSINCFFWCPAPFCTLLPRGLTQGSIYL